MMPLQMLEKNYRLNVMALRDEYSSFICVYQKKEKKIKFNFIIEMNKDLATS